MITSIFVASSAKWTNQLITRGEENMFVKNIAKVVFVSAIVFASAVQAAWTIDEAGVGFVGKGDIQLIYGWNNKALQDNAVNVIFRAKSGSVTEYTWTCDRDNGPQTQERARSTTTTITGLLSSVARERNQITGFNLLGWIGDTQQSVTESEGPALLSCANGWTAINPAEETTAIPGSGIQVSIDNAVWLPLPDPAPVI